MIDFLKTWANQIIVAVIIATILEMIIPNGKNKKYIKMIIGIYVLFTVIQPIFSKITGNSIEISDINYKKYFSKEIFQNSTVDFENNNSKLIEQAYIDNIKNDIKTKLKQKGYNTIDIRVNTITDEKNNNYGMISNLKLKIDKIDKEQNKEVNNAIKIDEININNKIVNDLKTNNSLSNEEKKEIIEYLENEYSITKKNIIIN